MVKTPFGGARSPGPAPFSLDSISDYVEHVELERFLVMGKVGIIAEMEVKCPVRAGETGQGHAGDVHGMFEVQ
jgi:hypothetical protein